MKRALLILLFLVGLSFLADCFMVRIGLAAHGTPFAQIIPKQHFGLRVFDYVDHDSLRAEALVFSHNRAIGWVYHGIDNTRGFVPFTGDRHFVLPPRYFSCWGIPSAVRCYAVVFVSGAVVYLLVRRAVKKSDLPSAPHDA